MVLLVRACTTLCIRITTTATATATYSAAGSGVFLLEV
jgi:hypothetical protein